MNIRFDFIETNKIQTHWFLVLNNNLNILIHTRPVPNDWITLILHIHVHVNACSINWISAELEKLEVTVDIFVVFDPTIFQFMDDDATLLHWLLTLEQQGLCLIEDAPLKENVVIDICNRVFFPKRNYYGYRNVYILRLVVYFVCFFCKLSSRFYFSDIFHVKSKLTPNNLAYTSTPLGFHIDIPQLMYTPGVSKK